MPFTQTQTHTHWRAHAQTQTHPVRNTHAEGLFGVFYFPFFSTDFFLFFTVIDFRPQFPHSGNEPF